MHVYIYTHTTHIHVYMHNICIHVYTHTVAGFHMVFKRSGVLVVPSLTPSFPWHSPLPMAAPPDSDVDLPVCSGMRAPQWRPPLKRCEFLQLQ